MKAYTCIIIALSVVFLCSCATTDDPSKGGLFSYNPDAYEKRQQERRTKLKQLREEEDAGKARQTELQASVQQKKQTRDSWAAKLRAVNKESAALRKQLSEYSPQNEAQHSAKQDLEKRRTDLDVFISAAGSSNRSDAEKEAELERLRREVEQLTREFNALSLL